MSLKELVALEPRKPFLREYTDRPLEEDEIRAVVDFAAPKHGTELSHYRGVDPFQNNYFDEEWQLFCPDEEAQKKPFCMSPGNMWVGKISEMGSKVTGFQMGQRIAGYGPLKNTHTLKMKDALVMTNSMTWKEAVCYDPMQFALGGIRDGHIRCGDNVVIFGLGAIGLIAAQLAKLSGAAKVIVIDPIECRRTVAIENGADIALDPTACDAGLEIKKATNKVGADVIIETSGTYVALQAAIRGCAYQGNIAVVGWYKECNGILNLGREAHFNQPNIFISRACSEPNRDYPRWNFDRICKTSWEMLKSGQIKCENIVNPVVDFENSAEAYAEVVDQHPERSVKLGVKF